jgi:hypothetical protein
MKTPFLWTTDHSHNWVVKWVPSREKEEQRSVQTMQHLPLVSPVVSPVLLRFFSNGIAQITDTACGGGWSTGQTVQGCKHV